MSEYLQRNRQYELIIGNYKSGDGLLITDLQVSFDISKSADNKKRQNSASIEIYNLSDESLKYLDSDYPAAVFSAGYIDSENIKRLFAGEVTLVTTRKSGADRITQIQMGTGYTELNHQVLNELVTPGKTIKDVVEAIRSAMPGVSRAVYNGTNLNNPILYGYPLMGTPKDMLDELSSKYAVSWQIENDVLYVHDNLRANRENFDNTAYVVGPHSGLIEIPYRVSLHPRRSKKDPQKKPGVQWKMLLNPDIHAGDVIKLEDTEINGWFKVESIRHSGSFRENPWYTEIQASSIKKVSV